jgi:tetratricopeptide (TPR) repeat protein
MAELERVLVPGLGQNQRQKIHVLHGLGGIGKTQLAVEFARRHYRRFSSVFWLDGRREDILKRSIASCAGRIPQGQIPETSRGYAGDNSADVDAVVKDVMAWLARPDNTVWLLIFDNVDREYAAQGGDPDAYDVRRYFSGADHGSVLVTTRLARLEQLGDSQQLGKVSAEQGQAILDNWYKEQHGESAANIPVVVFVANTTCIDAALGKQLLKRLDGLPLAIAQAGAYLQESGIGLTTYLRFYEQQWDELMEVGYEGDAPLQDYPNRSVWTTWVISYQAVRKKHELTANLLLLWSFLDNGKLSHDLFAAACEGSAVAKSMLSGWIGQSATSELAFSQAMRLLRSYSLIEVLEDAAGYATHPLVHRWAHHQQAKRFASELGPLAVVVVGWAVPGQSSQDDVAIQRRLLPHAQMCSSWLFHYEPDWDLERSERFKLHCEGARKDQTLVGAMCRIGRLYVDQSKLVEAALIHKWALQRYEEALGSEDILTLKTMGSLGMVYMNQGRLTEAECMIKGAAKGLSEMLAPKSELVLQMAGNLGMVYKKQGKLGDAENSFKQVLQGMEETLGPEHKSTLLAYNNLGILYKNQDRLEEADRMLKSALRGKEVTLGPYHPSTLQTIGNMGIIYFRLGKLVEAESMYERALRGKEKVLGQKHISTVETVGNLGNLYTSQGKLMEAEQMYERALQGFDELLGARHPSTQQTIVKLIAVYYNRKKLAEALQMQERVLLQ